MGCSPRPLAPCVAIDTHPLHGLVYLRVVRLQRVIATSAQDVGRQPEDLRDRLKRAAAVAVPDDRDRVPSACREARMEPTLPGEARAPWDALDDEQRRATCLEGARPAGLRAQVIAMLAESEAAFSYREAGRYGAPHGAE